MLCWISRLSLPPKKKKKKKRKHFHVYAYGCTSLRWPNLSWYVWIAHIYRASSWDRNTAVVWLVWCWPSLCFLWWSIYQTRSTKIKTSMPKSATIKDKTHNESWNMTTSTHQYHHSETITYRQLRARRALMLFKDVPYRTLLVLSGTSLSTVNALLALSRWYVCENIWSLQFTLSNVSFIDFKLRQFWKFGSFWLLQLLQFIDSDKTLLTWVEIIHFLFIIICSIQKGMLRASSWTKGLCWRSLHLNKKK